MKLLLDENLSPSLCKAVEDLFPGSIHVRDQGLKSAPDAEVWTWAKQRGFAILSKDAGFRQRSLLQGHPPKVIWVALGNCSTLAIQAVLRNRSAEIAEFLSDAQKAFLVLL